jgi:hypothetical protein
MTRVGGAAGAYPVGALTEPIRRGSTSMATFDEYLASVPEPQKTELERIRQLVRRAVPDAEESVSYEMPAFSTGSGRCCWTFA